jgi:pectin methylesterase-like acyl-CoA thioesterase
MPVPIPRPLPQLRHLLTTLLTTPSTLSALIPFLPISSLCALANSTRSTRPLLASAVLRNLVLAHYIPTFASALALADPTRSHTAPVPITLHDLALFRESGPPARRVFAHY